MLSNRDIRILAFEARRYYLKKNKDIKGSHAWKKFRVVWDDNDEEVFELCVVPIVRIGLYTRS